MQEQKAIATTGKNRLVKVKNALIIWRFSRLMKMMSREISQKFHETSVREQHSAIHFLISKTVPPANLCAR
jgi:hypothetical protein